MTIEVSSPTRIDLAGGTLDCWPLYNLVDGAETINLAVPIFSRVRLELNERARDVELVVGDLNFRKKFSDVNEFCAAEDAELALVQHVVRYFRPRQGFRLETKSESPIGAGLGGSSSLCISLIKAFKAITGERVELWPTVTLAHNIEAQILKKPTGTQDYVPAIQPGLNIIHYTVEGPRLEPVQVEIQRIVSRMVLVYTGQPHHSGLNNWQVIKAAMDGERNTLLALRELKEIAHHIAEICRQGDWSGLAEAFEAEFSARVRLSTGFSSGRIEHLKQSMREHRVVTKICGAGGGGCVLLWTPEGAKEKVEAQCRKEGFQVLDITGRLSPSSSWVSL